MIYYEPKGRREQKIPQSAYAYPSLGEGIGSESESRAYEGCENIREQIALMKKDEKGESINFDPAAFSLLRVTDEKGISVSTLCQSCAGYISPKEWKKDIEGVNDNPEMFNRIQNYFLNIASMTPKDEDFSIFIPNDSGAGSNVVLFRHKKIHVNPSGVSKIGCGSLVLVKAGTKPIEGTELLA